MPPEATLNEIARLVGLSVEDAFGDVLAADTAHGAREVSGQVGSRNGAGEPMGDSEFWRRYDAIEESDLPESVKVHKVDALAALFRARSQDRDSATAADRTRLMALEVEAGRERTREVARAVDRSPTVAPAAARARKTGQAAKRGA